MGSGGNGNAVAASPLPEIILISCRNCSGNFHIREGLFRQKGLEGAGGRIVGLAKVDWINVSYRGKKKKHIDIELQRCKGGGHAG